MKAPGHVGVYLPSEILAEVRAEAARQDRSFSHILRMAWKIAKERIKSFPSGMP